MAKNRNDYAKSLRPHLKRSALDVIGNIIIWGCPLVIMGLIIAFKWDSLMTSKTSTHIEFWAMLVIFIMMLTYLKWGRKKLRDKMNVDKINAEKSKPLVVFFNSLMNLFPFVLCFLIFDFCSNINEPIEEVLGIMLGGEVVGRVLLFIDSFREAEYED